MKDDTPSVHLIRHFHNTLSYFPLAFHPVEKYRTQR